MFNFLFSTKISVFSSREFAFLLTACVIAFFALCKKEVKSSAISLMSSLFKSNIQLVFWSSVFYIAICVWMLKTLGLWTTNDFKDTLVWTLSSSTVLIGQITSLTSSRDFQKFFLRQFQLFALVEYVIMFYSMPFIVEILLQPVLFLLIIINNLTQDTKKEKSLHDFYSVILNFFGLLIIVYSVVQLVYNYKIFASRQTLYSFLLPYVLLFLYLPYLWSIYRWAKWETFCSVLPLHVSNKALLSYIKRKASAFLLDTVLLDRLLQQIQISSVKSKQDVDKVIAELRHNAKNEKKPPEVQLDLGWSPWIAIHSLEEDGLNIISYSKIDDSESSCNYFSFSCKTLCKDPRYNENNLSYYINGEKNFATELKLHCHVSTNRVIGNTRRQLSEIASNLYHKAMSKTLHKHYVKKIRRGKSFSYSTQHVQVSFKKDYSNSLERVPYYLKFELKLIAR